MNEKLSEGGCSRGKNADLPDRRRCEPLLDNWMKTDNTPKKSTNGLDKQCKIWPGKKAEIIDTSDQILHRLPESNSQHPLKRYSRTQSETMIGYQAVTSPTKLKRVLSATEIKTRLAGCPKGLLIATEPPKSGESYRRRSSTDIKDKAVPLALERNSRSHEPDEVDENVYKVKENSNLLQEKQTVLLELEVVKREREQLQKENERLQEELENRNKVIDHLIDFMKSSIPGESRQLGDDFN